MRLKEAERLGLMRQVDKGTMSLNRASKELGLSLRQVKRIRKKYLSRGPIGLISEKRDVRSPNRTPDSVRETTFKLLKSQFSDFGPTLAKEKLEELHGIMLSRETIRKLMVEECLWYPKQRKK
jgi:DNA-binding Lrp family transcriptional regulator